MLLLLLFNEHEKLTYQQILQLTQISSQEIQAHLIPLIKTQLLVKEPAAHCFMPEDVLRVNWNYKSRLYKNKIAVMSSKV